MTEGSDGSSDAGSDGGSDECSDSGTVTEAVTEASEGATNPFSSFVAATPPGRKWEVVFLFAI